jgi:hypothetical protein
MGAAIPVVLGPAVMMAVVILVARSAERTARAMVTPAGRTLLDERERSMRKRSDRQF